MAVPPPCCGHAVGNRERSKHAKSTKRNGGSRRHNMSLLLDLDAHCYLACVIIGRDGSPVSPELDLVDGLHQLGEQVNGSRLVRCRDNVVLAHRSQPGSGSLVQMRQPVRRTA